MEDLWKVLYLWIGYPSLLTSFRSTRDFAIHYARRMAAKFFSNFFPRVKADDEELVDPQQMLRDKCREGKHVKELAAKYQTCNDRVNSRSQTAETCTEELFDMLHAIDHCVTEKLFHMLK